MRWDSGQPSHLSRNTFVPVDVIALIAWIKYSCIRDIASTVQINEIIEFPHQ